MGGGWAGFVRGRAGGAVRGRVWGGGQGERAEGAPDVGLGVVGPVLAYLEGCDVCMGGCRASGGGSVSDLGT